MRPLRWTAYAVACLSICLLAIEPAAGQGRGGRGKPSSVGKKPSFSKPGSSVGKKPSFGKPGSSVGKKPSFGKPGGSVGKKPSFGTPGGSVGKKPSFGKSGGPGNKPSFGTPGPGKPGQPFDRGHLGNDPRNGEHGPGRFSDAFGSGVQQDGPAHGNWPKDRAGTAEAASEAAANAAEAASSAAQTAIDLAQAATSYDYDYNVHVDVDHDGYYPWNLPPAYAWPVVVPDAAALYGIAPTYYSWYYPPPSSAMVTTIHADGSTTTATDSGTTTSAATTTVVDQGGSAGSGQSYSDPVSAAVDDLARNPDASSLMQQGTQLFQQRDYSGAEEAFRRAAPLEPDNGLPRFSHAHALFALADYDGTSYQIRRGLDLMPDWIHSGNNVRALYGNQQDFEDQHQALVSAIRADPEDAEALAVLGYVDFFSNRLDSAHHVFTRLATLRPDDPIAPFFLAEIERRQQYVGAR